MHVAYLTHGANYERIDKTPNEDYKHDCMSKIFRSVTKTHARCKDDICEDVDNPYIKSKYKNGEDTRR